MALTRKSLSDLSLLKVALHYMCISVRERFIQCISFVASTVWLRQYKCQLGFDMVFLIKNA